MSRKAPPLRKPPMLFNKHMDSLWHKKRERLSLIITKATDKVKLDLTPVLCVALD